MSTGAEVTVLPSSIDPASPALAAFRSGEATHAASMLGANLTGDGAVDFAVWAPNAERVELIGEFEGWKGTPLARVGTTGIFGARLKGPRVGQKYKYRVFSKAG